MKLRRDEIRSEMAKVDGWRLRGKQISRLFVFKDFAEGIRFVSRVARLAEAMNHHPDIYIQYNRIKLKLTTHDEGGLTRKDFRLARQINKSLNK